MNASPRYLAADSPEDDQRPSCSIPQPVVIEPAAASEGIEQDLQELVFGRALSSASAPQITEDSLLTDESARQMSPAPPGPRSNKQCRCKRSQCLKLYCECFAANVYCIGCKVRRSSNHPYTLLIWLCSVSAVTTMLNMSLAPAAGQSNMRLRSNLRWSPICEFRPTEASLCRHSAASSRNPIATPQLADSYVFDRQNAQ